MKYKFKKIIKQARRLSLSSEERRQMLLSLENHISQNPQVAPILWQEESSHIFAYIRRIANSGFGIPALVFFLLVSAGLSSYASEYSLPGDLLYPVKILNEKVESGLALNQDSVEKIDTKHAIARLEEAEVLQAQGRLNTENKAILSNAFHSSFHDIANVDEGKFISQLPQTAQAALSFIDSTTSSSIEIGTSINAQNKDQKESHKKRDREFVIAAKQNANISGTSAAAVSGISASSSATTTASVAATSTASSTATSSESKDERQSSFAVTIPAVQIMPVSLPKL